MGIMQKCQARNEIASPKVRVDEQSNGSMLRIRRKNKRTTYVQPKADDTRCYQATI
jgi:hypothetical protein